MKRLAMLLIFASCLFAQVRSCSGEIPAAQENGAPLKMSMAAAEAEGQPATPPADDCLDICGGYRGDNFKTCMRKDSVSA